MSALPRHAAAVRSPVEQRRSGRDLVDHVSRFDWKDSDGVPRYDRLRIVNLSAHGLMARTAIVLPVGSHIRIDLPHAGATAARIRWMEGGRIGVEFVRPFSDRDYGRLIALIPARERAGEERRDRSDRRAAQRH